MRLRAIVYCPWQTFERRYLIAAQVAGMELHACADLQDFASQLFRDQAAIGILWSQGGASAAETVRRARQGNIKNRIIALIHSDETSAIVLAEDRISVLAAGADDAQSSLIEVAELAARLKVLADRGAYLDHLHVELAGCTYDHNLGEIHGGATGTVKVTKLLGKLLVALARFPGETRSKRDIMDALYGHDDGPEPKIIDVLIHKLRDRIMLATGGLDCIETVWGRGYRFNGEGYTPETPRPRDHERGPYPANVAKRECNQGQADSSSQRPDERSGADLLPGSPAAVPSGERRS